MTPKMVTVPLHRVAHARTGDKGNRVNISVIAYHAQTYPYLVEQITPDVVADVFAHRGATRVQRFELPKLHAMNVVIDNVLEGGVNGSLNLDGHGKTLSFLLLSHDIQVPQSLLTL